MTTLSQQKTFIRGPQLTVLPLNVSDDRTAGVMLSAGSVHTSQRAEESGRCMCVDGSERLVQKEKVFIILV